jgi:hypothetical protein
MYSPISTYMLASHRHLPDPSYAMEISKSTYSLNAVPNILSILIWYRLNSILIWPSNRFWNPQFFDSGTSLTWNLAESCVKKLVYSVVIIIKFLKADPAPLWKNVICIIRSLHRDILLLSIAHLSVLRPRWLLTLIALWDFICTSGITFTFKAFIFIPQIHDIFYTLIRVFLAQNLLKFLSYRYVYLFLIKLYNPLQKANWLLFIINDIFSSKYFPFKPLWQVISLNNSQQFCSSFAGNILCVHYTNWLKLLRKIIAFYSDYRVKCINASCRQNSESFQY